MIGSSYDEFNLGDWDNGFRHAVNVITKYIQKKKEYYADGSMCSISEAINGECICEDILKYLEELKP